LCKSGFFVHVLGSVPDADRAKTSRVRMPCVHLMMCIREKDMLVSFMVSWRWKCTAQRRWW
jgi:hypothetical protein